MEFSGFTASSSFGGTTVSHHIYLLNYVWVAMEVSGLKLKVIAECSGGRVVVLLMFDLY